MEIQGAEDYWLRGRLVINKAGQEDRSQIIQQNEIYLRPTLCQGSHTEIQIRHDFCPKGSHNLVVKWSFWICCQSSLLQVDPSLYSIYIQSPLSLESDRVVKKKKNVLRIAGWMDGQMDGWNTEKVQLKGCCNTSQVIFSWLYYHVQIETEV